MKMPEYSISEEYEDDPHWNSGVWETTISFKDGKTIKFLERKNSISPSQIAERYKYLLFEEFWAENKEKYKEMARKDFILSL